MAEAGDPDTTSLLSLEDDLTCSICLSLFQCPVTIPCGHNFCQACLLSSWKDSYCCPHCRTVFATRPELKKNTVLSTVVDAFHSRSGRSEAPGEESRRPDNKAGAVLCDACMKAEASKTCLTCMASYCEEHLQPHLDNPVFRLHQLGPPVPDLMERICKEHHKLMELFCSQHGRSICSLCLHQEHKGCSVTSLEEQRSLKESDYRKKLSLLNDKIQKTSTVLSQLDGAQRQLEEAASHKKKALAAMYRQIQDMLAQDECETQREVDREVEMGQKKLRDTRKTLSQNSEKLELGRENINSLLVQTQDRVFLQTLFELPKAAKFEPRIPQITLDSDKLKATETFVCALKESLTEILNEPVEARPTLLKSGEKPANQSGSPKTEKSGAKPKQETAQKSRTRSKSAGRPLIQPHPQPPPHFHPPPPFHPPGAAYMRLCQGERPPPPPAWIPVEARAHQQYGTQRRHPKFTTGPDQWTQAQRGPDAPPDASSAQKRSQLLKHGVTLTFDPYTAHKRVVLSDAFTKASVPEERGDPPDCTQRFDLWTQVLATEGFTRGRHYWEVQLGSLRFIGVGLAYGSMDRKGLASRLGRNARSWCVEWSDGKTSAWHNGSETQIASVSARRVGVLLDYEEGTATLFRVADQAYPFHTFVFPFTEAVYPAFWISSGDSTVTLCNMKSG